MFSYLIRSTTIFLIISLPLNIYGEKNSDIIKKLENPRKEFGWILDQARVLGSTELKMNNLINRLEKETGIEIAVVILNSIGENVPKEFATELFRTWGIGKKDKNNGILVLHIMDQKRIEIETGYGMEGILTDLKCNFIIQKITIPYFKRSDFAMGHLNTLQAIIQIIHNPTIPVTDVISGKKQIQNLIPYYVNTSNPESIITIGKLKYYYPFLIPIFLFIIWMLFIAINAALNDSYKVYVMIKSNSLYFALALCVVSVAYIFFIGSAFLVITMLVISLLFFSFLYSFALKKFRNKPRVCSVCNNKMVLLNEDEDDNYLGKGQRTEENIHSIDYDVWKCQCGNILIETYKNSSVATRCLKCNFITEKFLNFDIVLDATYSSTGLKREYYKCTNCQNEYSKEVIIPIKTRSDGSGRSRIGRFGGGRSGSGSFGGGSSGGGGAGGSY